MTAHLRPTIVLLAVFTVVLGLLYPAAMTLAGGALFGSEAAGSLVLRDGRPVGSALIAQGFTGAGYLHPRPSVAGTAGYDASSSSGTNLGPTSAKLAARLAADGAALRAQTGPAVLPADAITTSGSGLDPDISPAFAELQVARIAAARGVPPETVRRLISENTQGRTLAILGEPRVNVLLANLALDAAAPMPGSAAPVAAN